MIKFLFLVFNFSGLISIAGKVDGGSRTEEEEKVYSWLYTLAQSEKNMVFEYVRSTERGKYLHSTVVYFFFGINRLPGE
jgi:Mg2+-importing ATPase